MKTSTTTARKSSKALKAEMLARLNRIGEGIQAEVEAVNAAIRSGVVVTIPVRAGSLMSGKTVERVSNCHDGIWVTMKSYGGRYSLANDGRWAEIVDLAGVARDPRAETAFGR